MPSYRSNTPKNSGDSDPIPEDKKNSQEDYNDPADWVYSEDSSEDDQPFDSWPEDLPNAISVHAAKQGQMKQEPNLKQPLPNEWAHP